MVATSGSLCHGNLSSAPSSKVPSNPLISRPVAGFSRLRKARFATVQWLDVVSDGTTPGLFIGLTGMVTDEPNLAEGTLNVGRPQQLRSEPVFRIEYVVVRSCSFGRRHRLVARPYRCATWTLSRRPWRASFGERDWRKVITIADLDPNVGSFVVRIKGFPSDSGEAWWTQRKLDLSGPLFEAQRMLIPSGDRQKGKGRMLMADLVDTAARFGIHTITIEAQDIGRYAWARFGPSPTVLPGCGA